jgi:hypothetical protein
MRILGAIRGNHTAVDDAFCFIDGELGPLDDVGEIRLVERQVRLLLVSSGRKRLQDIARADRPR